MSILVQRQAPDFTAPTVMPDNQIDEKFNFRHYVGNNPAVLFFYPLDFTFVCPSEIIAFDHRIEAFEERGVKVIGVSVDSHFTHLAWRNTLVERGGIGQVRFPLVADLSKKIANNYDVLVDESVALRASFLIDKDGVVRHQLVNDLPLGRNVDEMLRMVDALQFHEKHGEVCPANWRAGSEGMEESSDGVSRYLAKHAASL